jgi:hypothetical protein
MKPSGRDSQYPPRPAGDFNSFASNVPSFVGVSCVEAMSAKFSAAKALDQ